MNTTRTPPPPRPSAEQLEQAAQFLHPADGERGIIERDDAHAVAAWLRYVAAQMRVAPAPDHGRDNLPGGMRDA